MTFGSEVNISILAHDTRESIPACIRDAADEILFYSPKQWAISALFNRGARRLLRRDIAQESFLKQHGVRAILTAGATWQTAIPVMYLIPDFQHIHLPEMFSLKESQTRNRVYEDVAKWSTRVILLSDSAKNDFAAFAPRFAHKARVLNPVGCIPDSVYEVDPKLTSDFYHLPTKFIYLPNQFWKHKNHGVVFQALKTLMDKGIEAHLVCSGYPGDFRHPAYFSDLLLEISTLGIQGQVTLLGMLPRDHVLRLMRYSVCVLNPSLFEGYGMTVDEARSLGKQLILSDIPVHREQNPPQAIFFEPRDPNDLAMCLEWVWANKSPGPDARLEEEARSTLPGRISNYAQSFIAIVREIAPVPE